MSIKNINGIERICINEKPVFLHGVLDQGYYCDGIFLPSSEKGFENDILKSKEITLDMYNSRSRYVRVKESISRLLSPIL